MHDNFYDPWPKLSYEAFNPTLHLLHMAAQMLGKLRLAEPFELHWDGVPLALTTSGLSTGPLSYNCGAFSVDMDFIKHQVIAKSSWGQEGAFKLGAMSVAAFHERFCETLRSIGIAVRLNPLPCEVPNPIPFGKDVLVRHYDTDLAQRWWRIILSIQRVMQRYHARFGGRTPPIGLMWGTFDLRDVRYNGISLSTDAVKNDYIRRNAMDEAHIEIGWWCGNDAYPRPAFFSYTHPKPPAIEYAKISPPAARWDASLGEFILDYDDLLKMKDPDQALLSFFESTYEAGAERAQWNKKLVVSGKPI